MCYTRAANECLADHFPTDEMVTAFALKTPPVSPRERKKKKEKRKASSSNSFRHKTKLTQNRLISYSQTTPNSSVSEDPPLFSLQKKKKKHKLGWRNKRKREYLKTIQTVNVMACLSPLLINDIYYSATLLSSFYHYLSHWHCYSFLLLYHPTGQLYYSLKAQPPIHSKHTPLFFSFFF